MSRSDPEFDETEEPTDPQGLIAHLRRELGKRDKTIKDLRVVEREVAFIKADLDVSTPVGVFFAKNFDGDLSDVESLKSQALALGVTLRTPPAPAEGAQGAQADQSAAAGQPAPAEGQQQAPAQAAAQAQEGQQAAAQQAAQAGQTTGSLERQILAEGAKPGGQQQGVDPREQNLEQARDEMRKGASGDSAMAGFIARAAQNHRAANPVPG